MRCFTPGRKRFKKVYLAYDEDEYDEVLQSHGKR